MWRFLLALISLPAVAQPLLLEPNFPAGEGPNDFVRSLVVQPDQRILAGGNFQQFNATMTGPLVRLLPDGTLDPEFRPGPFLGSTKPTVSQVWSLSDGRILIDGNFTNIGGLGRTNLAVLKANGEIDPSFQLPEVLPRSSFPPSLIPATDGGFWIRGSFTNVGGIASARLAKLRVDGSVDTNFASPFAVSDGSAFSILPLPDGRIVLTGSFTNLAGVPVPRIARLLPTGALDPAFQPDLPLNFQLSRLTRMPDGALVGAVSRQGEISTPDAPFTLLRLQPDGKMDPTFAPRFDYPSNPFGAFNRVLALLPEPNGNLLIAGTFLQIDGTMRNGLARLLPDGSLSHCFDPGLGTASFVISLAQQADGDVLLGGVFRAVEGQHRPYLARLNGDPDCTPGTFAFSAPEFVVDESAPSALVTVVRSGSAARVETVTVSASDGTAHSGEDYIGGTFEVRFELGETARAIPIPVLANPPVEGAETVQLTLQSRSAAIKEPSTAILRILDHTNVFASGAVDPGFRPEISGPVLAAAIDTNGNVAASFAYTNSYGYADYSRYSLVRIRADGTGDPTFVSTNLFDDEVRAVAFLPDGRILAGGSFGHINGIVRPGLARFDAGGHLDETFDPFADFIPTNGFRYPAVSALLVLDDGSIMGTGKIPETVDSAYGFRIFRISSGGVLDRSFLAAQERESASAAALASFGDGSWIIALPGENAPVARIFSNGIRDARFIPPPFHPASASTLAVMPDHSILAGGWAAYPLTPTIPGLVRLAPNGGGIAPFLTNISHALNLTESRFDRLLLESGGSFLAGGTFKIGASDGRTTILRFHGDGTLDPSFDAGTGATGRFTPQSTNITILPEIHVLERFPGGGWLVGGDFAGFDGSSQPFLVRLLPEREEESSFHLTTDRWEIPETAGELWIDVVRSGTATSQANVTLATVAETGVPNVDFTPVNAELEFAPGEWIKHVSIPIISNDLAQSNRVFRIELNGTVSSPGAASVTIVDDDVNVEFTSSEFTVHEGEPFVVAGIRRIGIIEDAVSAKVKGTDFEQTVTFSANPNASATNYIRIPIRDDDQYLPNAQLPLRLEIASGNATPGPRATAVVHIIENDFPEAAGRGVAGSINVIAPAPNGGVYLGGGFSAVHGIQRANIARLLPGGDVDPAFASSEGPDGAVTALLVQNDGGVLIGGEFSSVGGQFRAHVARLGPDGKVDESFNPGAGPVSNTNYPVKILAFATNTSGAIYVGGRFLTFRGFPAHAIVRLQPNGTMDMGFASPLGNSGSLSRFPPYSSGSPSTVTEIYARSNGVVIVGDLNIGNFSVFNPKFRSATLTALEEYGAPATNFVSINTVTPATTIVPLPDGSWLAGSTYSRSLWSLPLLLNSSNWVAIRKLQADGEVDLSFVVRQPPDLGFASSAIRKILVDAQGRILFLAEVVGTNSTRFGQTVLARLLPDGTWDASFPPVSATNSMMTSLIPKFPFNDPLNSAEEMQSAASIRGLAQQADGTIVLGGSFNEIDGEPRWRLARVDPAGELRGLLRLAISEVRSDLLRLTSGAEVEVPYVIEGSTDLLTWLPLRTNSVPQNPISIFAEPEASGAVRFFRARALENPAP